MLIIQCIETSKNWFEQAKTETSPYLKNPNDKTFFHSGERHLYTQHKKLIHVSASNKKLLQLSFYLEKAKTLNTWTFSTHYCSYSQNTTWSLRQCFIDVDLIYRQFSASSFQSGKKLQTLDFTNPEHLITSDLQKTSFYHKPV